MRTFAAKQNPRHQPASPGLTGLRRPVSAESQRVSFSHHLQRTIGNQALQRLVRADAEKLKTGSAASRFDYDFTRLPVFPATSKTVQNKPAIGEPGDAFEQDAAHIAARAAQMPIAKVSDGSRPVMQRKCAACESGPDLCTECGDKERRAQRMASTNAMPAVQRKIEAPEKGIEELGGKKTPGEMKLESAKCPDQIVRIGFAKCGDDCSDIDPKLGNCYGALAVYSYIGAKDWWFMEKVTSKHTPKMCEPNPDIQQNDRPFQTRDNSGSIDDIITNPGSPASVAPCKQVTEQTVFAGPTEADVKHCRYHNKQTIEVTLDEGSNPRSGEVITTSEGKSDKCTWTEAP